MVKVKLVAGAKPLYWKVYGDGKLAGKAYIDAKNSSVSVFLNKPSQGKGIGRIAFRQACELSGLPVVYAYIAKKNIASIKATTAAGFKRITPEARQVVMVWRSNLSR